VSSVHGSSAALATVWARVVGGAAMRRAIPVWAGVGIVAAIVFGGTGMRVGDLTRIARQEPGVGVALGAMWLVLVAPVGAAIADARATAWLRALPSARWARRGVNAVIAMIVQLPWIALWGGGDGVLAAVAMGGAAAAIMMMVARVRWPLPARAPRWRGAIRALAGVHVRALVRTRGAAIARAIAWALCAGAAAGLIARSNQLDDGGAVSALLIAVAIAAPMGLSGLAAPVADSDRAVAWAAIAASDAARAAAQALVLAIAGAAMALVAAIAAVLLWRSGAAGMILAQIAAAAALGAGLGAGAARVGAWAATGPITDGTRVVVGMTGAAVLAAAAVGALGAWAIALVAASGGALAAAMAAPRGAA